MRVNSLSERQGLMFDRIVGWVMGWTPPDGIVVPEWRR
jgi:hypothetical protein